MFICNFALSCHCFNFRNCDLVCSSHGKKEEGMMDIVKRKKKWGMLIYVWLQKKKEKEGNVSYIVSSSDRWWRYESVGQVRASSKVVSLCVIRILSEYTCLYRMELIYGVCPILTF